MHNSCPKSMLVLGKVKLFFTHKFYIIHSFSCMNACRNNRQSLKNVREIKENIYLLSYYEQTNSDKSGFLLVYLKIKERLTVFEVNKWYFHHNINDSASFFFFVLSAWVTNISDQYKYMIKLFDLELKRSMSTWQEHFTILSSVSKRISNQSSLLNWL